MTTKQTGKRYSHDEKAKLLGLWESSKGTNAQRFETVKSAGYTGSLSGWLQNVRSWAGPKAAKKAASVPVEAPVAPAPAPKAPAPAKLKRGRVGPDERAKIIEALKAGTAAAELAAKYNRSEKIVLALMEQPKASKAAKPAPAVEMVVALEHADPLSGIPELFRDEFVSMILEKIEQEHKHSVRNTTKKDDAVRLFFKIKEVLKDYDALIEKLKQL